MGGRRSQGSRAANLPCFERGVDRGDPIGISARLYRFPSRIRRSQMQLKSNGGPFEREVVELGAKVRSGQVNS